MSRVRSPYWPNFLRFSKLIKSRSLWYLYMWCRRWIDQWRLRMPGRIGFGRFWNYLLRWNRFQFWSNPGRFHKNQTSHWPKNPRSYWPRILKYDWFWWNLWKYTCATDETNQLLEDIDYSWGLDNPEVCLKCPQARVSIGRGLHPIRIVRFLTFSSSEIWRRLWYFWISSNPSRFGWWYGKWCCIWYLTSTSTIFLAKCRSHERHH